MGVVSSWEASWTSESKGASRSVSSTLQASSAARRIVSFAATFGAGSLGDAGNEGAFPRDERIERKGAVEEEALPETAVEGEELSPLGLGLDAFGDDLQTEFASEVDHGPDDCGVARVDAEAGNEARVDLQRVSR